MIWGGGTHSHRCLKRVQQGGGGTQSDCCCCCTMAALSAEVLCWHVSTYTPGRAWFLCPSLLREVRFCFSGHLHARKKKFSCTSPIKNWKISGVGWKGWMPNFSSGSGREMNDEWRECILFSSRSFKEVDKLCWCWKLFACDNVFIFKLLQNEYFISNQDFANMHCDVFLMIKARTPVTMLFIVYYFRNFLTLKNTIAAGT